MSEELFNSDYGVIMAIDMPEPDDIRYVVDVCNRTAGVVALKAGSIPMMRHGLKDMVAMLRGITDLPLIYDHQKMGTSPPAPGLDTDDDGLKQGELFGALLGEFGIEGGIVYPTGDFIVHGLPADLSIQGAFTESFRKNGVEPFILGRFTCNGHLRKEGGLLPDNMPAAIYRRAAESGVGYYIMPGNRPDETRGFVDLVGGILPAGITPRISLPGFGSQGGTVRKAFEATQGLPSYAIIGPLDCFDISERAKVEEHVRRYCGEALAFG